MLQDNNNGQSSSARIMGATSSNECADSIAIVLEMLILESWRRHFNARLSGEIMALCDNFTKDIPIKKRALRAVLQADMNWV